MVLTRRASTWNCQKKKNCQRKVKLSHYTSSCRGMGKLKIDSHWFAWKEKPAQNRERQSGFLECEPIVVTLSQWYLKF